MGRKLDANEFAEMFDIFNNEIFVFMCENRKLLHDTFEYSRENNPRFYTVSSNLWHDTAGKEYLRSKMRTCGGKPSPKHLTRSDFYGAQKKLPRQIGLLARLLLQ